MNISKFASNLIMRFWEKQTIIAGIQQEHKKTNEYKINLIKGKGNVINASSSTLINVSLEVNGDNNRIEIGEGSRLNETKIYVRGSNNVISIAEKCRFINGGSLWIEDSHCQLIIGASTSFVSAHLAVTESSSKLEIGRDCMFAYDIDVRTGDSHSIIDTESGNRVNPAENICIGNHVWVAAHVNILKGVRIMDNCVIGTGSIVVKGGAESNAIYAGNPAKIIRKNISWTRERL